MRIITGKYKGRTLFSPTRDGVRPTSDRVREAQFSILYSRGGVEDKRVLDLFAGTGALGIEALSRGAKSCVFCDLDTRLCASNINKVGASARVISGDYRQSLKKLSGEKFDLIFIDPPYGKDYEFDSLNIILSERLLSENGYIFLEVSSENPLSISGGYDIIDKRTIGQTAIALIKYSSAED